MILNQIAIVLARPSHPGNIGSAARAMKTMGIKELHLVEPKIFPSTEAYALAAGADDILDQAQIHKDLSSALCEASLAVAFTSRKRELTAPILNLKDALPEWFEHLSNKKKVALVFGNETSGLNIQEVGLCNRLVTIPGNPDYFSLNLAQAVQIAAYECYQQSINNLPHKNNSEEFVTRASYENFYQSLEQSLLKSGFLNNTRGKNTERLMRRLRTLFDRSNLREEEMDILRGMIKSLESPPTN
jgi:tRNA/rRNA methyltransferase